MTHTDITAAPPKDARAWAKTLADYNKPNSARAILEFALSFLPFVALWAAMAFALLNGYWMALLLVVPAAGFLLRLFMIQHDCGHGAFFGNSLANDWTGRAIGVLTLTPYSLWKRTHAIHHAGSGCLDRRGFGEIATLTVEEYRALPGWERFKYRLYRHPLVLFGVGPAFLFIVDHRLPTGMMRKGWQPWLSTMGTNLAIAAVVAPLVWLVGLKVFLAIQLPITILAATIGVWLFFVQHQFEETSWERLPEWKRQEAALHGSSHYDLPAPLRWMTGNIGVHHVHHLSARIPFYRLSRVLRDHPELRDMNRMTLLDSLKTIPLALWDEAQHRMISFREYRRGTAATAAA
ncbi:fatty acid desaturase [Oricola thermophila]|uniref:Fatty acid desaturase n=1 Tax=Oricola thermophila TaxID=2742145 RepID=A0A6N1VGJ7_9HYPH|nr:fatty acid desaturase [Oricola thermophila]QKV19944.1 fatty acid desaturase [Oricola thermophila]